MGRNLVLVFVLMAAACAAATIALTRNTAAPASPAGGRLAHDDIAVYFSPSGGCTDAVVNQIAEARKQIHLQAYSFTSAPIARALVEAHKRGVDVQAVLDKSQRTEKYSSATFLMHAGIPVYIDEKHAIAHNKIILIDGEAIITGSFNFTKSAEESNAENLLILRGRGDLCARYERNFQEHLTHSEAYEGTQK